MLQNEIMTKTQLQFHQTQSPDRVHHNLESRFSNNNNLTKQLDQAIHSEELNQILRTVKSLKDLRNDDVTTIDMMLGSPFEGMTTIQEFTAVHIDFKLDKAIEELIDELNSKK